MKKIEVRNLKPGMAFDKPIYIDKQNILVDAYEPLKPSDIERLTKWNIREVETDGVEATPKIRIREIEPEGMEKIDIDKAIVDLKKAASANDTFLNIINNGGKILAEAYEALSTEKPYQVSNIRNLAEEIITLSTENPIGFINLYYQNYNQTLYTHIMFSALFGAYMANGLEFSVPKSIELVFSILLMDVGMVMLPTSIRMKEGKLNESEKAQLQAHPLRAYQILTQTAKVKNSVAITALQHQEFYDGSGYPQHLKGEQISEFARIAAIADSYSALLEDKNYRKRKLPYEAMKELLAYGLYRYDPNYMKHFLYKFSVYPVGSLVELSDRSYGLVVRSGHDKPMRPLVYIYRNPLGHYPENLRFIHLLYRPEFYIVNPVLPENAGFSFEAEMESVLSKSH